MLTGPEKKKMVARLKRIEGQIGGLHRMIETETYCVEVLNQFSAVQGALSKAAQIILEAHLETCVATAAASGSDAEAREKLKELVEVFGRFGRVIGK